MSTGPGLRANFSCYFRKIDFKLKLFLRRNISGDNAQDAECVAICSVLNKKEILNRHFIFSNHRNDNARHSRQWCNVFNVFTDRLQQPGIEPVNTGVITPPPGLHRTTKKPLCSFSVRNLQSANGLGENEEAKEERRRSERAIGDSENAFDNRFSNWGLKSWLNSNSCVVEATS